MGFSENACKRALLTVGGTNVEAAMNWVFEHNSDADLNDPVINETAGSTSTDVDVDEGLVQSLVDSLGCFTSAQVRVALKECGGSAERAADWLFSHMDDLDGAVQAAFGDDAAPSMPLEDGEGKYSMIGMISHIGKNTGSGHYVAHLKKDGKWVIFNDDKVALSAHAPSEHAYMYLFQRDDTIVAANPNYQWPESNSD
jgi:ubiquitin carboxyl-terminal hydrolase 5/13